MIPKEEIQEILKQCRQCRKWLRRGQAIEMSMDAIKDMRRMATAYEEAREQIAFLLAEVERLELERDKAVGTLDGLIDIAAVQQQLRTLLPL